MARGTKGRRDSLVRLNLDGLEARETPAVIGAPDPSFAGTGEVLLSGTPINGVAVQPDGKIIAVGSSGGDFLIERFNVDGSADTTFGVRGDGKVLVDIGVAGQSDTATAVKLDPSGKILVAGTGGSVAGNFALVRLTADGKIVEINKSYAVGSGASQVAGIDWQSSGAIVLAGTATNPDTSDTDMTVARVDPLTGAMIGGPTFVANAGADTASGVAVYHSQPHQDRIAVVGTATGQTDNDFAVARLNADGSLDTSFNAGSASHQYNLGGAGDVGRAVAIDGSNNIVVAGSTTGADGTSDFAVFRVLSSNSNLDSSFNVGSARIISGLGNDEGRTLAIQSDGRILIVGDSSIIPPAAPSSDTGGTTSDTTGSTTSDTTGSTTTGGTGSATGTGTGTETGTGTTTPPVPPAAPIPKPPATLPSADVLMVRLNADGTPDTSFGPNGMAQLDIAAGSDDRARAVTLSSSDRVILGGTTAAGDGYVTRMTGALEQSGTLAVSGNTNGTVAIYSANPATGQYNGSPTTTLAPFAPSGVEVRTATADVDGDGKADTIMVTGPNTAIRVQVISGADNSTVLVSPFDPFGGDFKGGGFVTAADFDGDGRADFAVTPDRGGGPRVVVFSLMNGSLVSRVSFFGIQDSGFRGGARTAAGDINNDGTPDLVVTAGYMGGPRVSVYDGRTIYTQSPPRELAHDFFAFSPELRNGAYAAVGDINGDGFGDIVFGAGAGGGPHIRVVSGAKLIADGPEEAVANPLANFFAGNADRNRGGVRVAVKDVDGDNLADIVAGTGEKQASELRFYLGKNVDGATNEPASQLIDPFHKTLPNGVFVG